MRCFPLLALVVGACAGASAPPPTAPTTTMPPAAPLPGTFEDDLAFLQKHGPVILLESKAGGRVAVSAKYQGRVMTSAVAKGSSSLGFVHRAFIEKGQTGTPFDNYGGEDRFWFGPEGGQFALYFPPGAPFKFDKWQTPTAMQEGPWPIKEQGPAHVVFERDMKLSNYAGTPFELTVTRTVRLLSAEDVAARIGALLPKEVKWVAFETENRITNTGARAWTKDKGLLSVWILGMYRPSPDARVVIPFDPRGQGDIVNDRYFGKVPPDRLRIDRDNGVLVFSCDGQYRSKLGLGPARAKPMLGSFSPSAHLLTLVQFDKPEGGPAGTFPDYVNSMWEVQSNPFGGDVVNSYNDGPTEPGKPSLGGFYELETSSPAAALAPGAALSHTHRTLHIVGGDAEFEILSKKAFGVPLSVAR